MASARRTLGVLFVLSALAAGAAGAAITGASVPNRSATRFDRVRNSIRDRKSSRGSGSASRTSRLSSV